MTHSDTNPAVCSTLRMRTAISPWQCHAMGLWGMPWGYAMLMSPNKDETAVHGCHCQGDMAVRIRKVLQTAGLVFECVTCFFRVSNV